MVKQKIVLKLPLDDESKRRKAFKAAVGMAGVTSASLEGSKIVVVGDGVDPIALATMLRRRLGHAELLSVSSGDDKKKDGYGHSYGVGGGVSKDGSESKGSISSKDGHGHAYGAVPSYPAYYQYSSVPSYPAYSYPYQQEATQDPGCSIM